MYLVQSPTDLYIHSGFELCVCAVITAVLVCVLF